MKIKFKMLLLKIVISILALYLAINLAKPYIHNQQEPIRIIEPQTTQIASSKYIISEQMIMSKLKTKSQIVSMQQNFNKKFTEVDNGLLGERETELSLNGSFKMGLNVKGIIIKHIDNENGIVHIKLPKPALISLELPYDQLQFDKTKGFMRLAMSEEEEKNFYKATKKEIEKELMNNSEIRKQANLYNQEVIKGLLMKIDGVNSIVFY